MSYVPGLPPLGEEQLARYLQEELQSISNAIAGLAPFGGYGVLIQNVLGQTVPTTAVYQIINTYNVVAPFPPAAPYLVEPDLATGTITVLESGAYAIVLSTTIEVPQSEIIDFGVHINGVLEGAVTTENTNQIDFASNHFEGSSYLEKGDVVDLRVKVRDGSAALVFNRVLFQLEQTVTPRG